MRTLSTLLAVLMLFASFGVSAHAAEPQADPPPLVVLASAGATVGPALYSAKPAAQGLVRKAASRACNLCRRICVEDWKYDCGTSGYCRRQFTLCMRACWYDYCR